MEDGEVMEDRDIVGEVGIFRNWWNGMDQRSFVKQVDNIESGLIIY